jgi:hypothetical protein
LSVMAVCQDMSDSQATGNRWGHSALEVELEFARTFILHAGIARTVHGYISLVPREYVRSKRSDRIIESIG